MNHRSLIAMFASALLLGCPGGGTDTDGGMGGGSGGSGGSGGGTSTGTVIAPTFIDAETTWSPVAGADCDVQVKGGININAALTIEAGTTICLDANARFVVQDNGSLASNGTAAEPVTFRGTPTVQTRGFWAGIWVQSNTVANSLSYTTITGGGGLEQADVRANLVVGNSSFVNQPARIKLDHLTSTVSGLHGLAVLPGAKLDTFTANTFSDNEGHPLRLPFEEATKLDAASIYKGVDGQPNGKQQVKLWVPSPGGPTIKVPVTLKKLDVPYGISTDDANRTQEFEAELTIEAGARLEFEASCGLIFRVAGKLTSNGTAADPVVLTGKSETKGFWKGVGLLSPMNTLASTEIIYAGNDDALCCGFYEPAPSTDSTKAALVVGDYRTTAGVTLTDVKLTQSKNRGLSLLSSSTATQMGTNDITTGNDVPNLGL